MKTKIRRVSRRTLSVVLSLMMVMTCMVVGSIPTVNAAAKQRYIYCGISDHLDYHKDSTNWGFKFWGGTSEGVKTPTYIANWDHDGRTYHVYRVQVYDDNNKAQFKGNVNWWIPSNGYSVTLNGTTNNAVFFSHNNDGWDGQFQENYQVTSTASLSATKTDMTIAESSTLTPSLSSNDTYNEIKSTTYAVTTNPNSGGSVTSAGVFTASKAGTYTVTATVTYNAKDFSEITSTATATQNITVNESTYNVTINSGADGSVKFNNSQTINAGGSQTVQVGATAKNVVATPAYGYKFNGWTKTGGVSVASTSNASTTVSASGTGTLTAQFTRDTSMNLYIAGRFHVKSGDSWVNSFDNGDWSNTGDDNIKFTWDSTTQKYKLDTNASIKNLSDPISSRDPWFFIYDKTNGKYWYRTTADTYLSTSNTSTTLTKYDNQTDAQNAKLRFNEQSTRKPVVIYFDPITGDLSFSTPTYYTVTVDGGDGSVSPNSVEASAATAVTLPTPTAPFGYKFKQWTTSSDGITITNPTSASEATVTATAAGTVTATYEADNNMNIYIVGRFRYRKSEGEGWTYTGTNEGDWDEYSTKIKLTSTGTDFLYKLETNATLAELSKKYGTEYQYFHIKSGSSTYYPSTNTEMTTTATTLGTSGPNNMYFDSASTRGPVTIYFNTNTKNIWYTIPDYYQITMNSATNGSYTVNGNSASYEEAEGKRVVIAATPNAHYALSTITVTTSGGATVATEINTTNNTATFTMPSAAVTVTVTFTQKHYSYTTAVAPTNNIATATPASGTLPGGTYVPVSTTRAQNQYNEDYGGYVFKNWTATNGVFGSASGDTTTTDLNPKFYPTASGAVATANYVCVRRISLGTVANAAVTISYKDIDGNDQTLVENSSAEALVNNSITVNVEPASDNYTTGSITNSDSSSPTSGTTYTLSWNPSVLSFNVNIISAWNLWVDDGASAQVFELTSNANKGEVSRTLTAQTAIGFKVYNTRTEKRYTADDETIADEAEEIFGKVNTGGNTKFTTTSAGSYKFKIDWSGEKPKVTVVFPGLTVTYNTVANATYGDKDVNVKAGQPVTFKVMPSPTYYVSSVTVSTGAEVSVAKNLDDEGYIVCTFIMPITNAIVTVGMSQISLSATVNTVNGGAVTDILDSSGSTVNPTKTAATGTAQMDNCFSIGDTYKIVVTRNSANYNLDRADLTGTGVSVTDFTPSSGNTFTYTCKVINSAINATAKFRATTPTVGTTSTTTRYVDKPFPLSDIFSATNYTTIKYKKDNASNWTETSSNLNEMITFSSVGNHKLQIQAINAPSGLDSNNSVSPTQTTTSSEVTLTIDFDARQKNFYIDAHDVNVTRISYKLYSDENCTTEMKNFQDDVYQGNFQKQSGVDADGNIGFEYSSVWGVEVTIPYQDDDVYMKITIVTSSETIYNTITLQQATLDNIEAFWYELANRGTLTSAPSYTTNSETSRNITYTVSGGSSTTATAKRIYIAIPSNETNWTDTPTIYFWSDSEHIAPDWNDTRDALKLKKIGTNTTTNDIYYYVDIPANTEQIILRGNTVKYQSGDTPINKNNFFKFAGRNVILTREDNVVEPYISKNVNIVTVNTTETGSYAVNIKPTYTSETGMSISYSSANPSYVTVDEYGNIGPLKDTFEETNSATIRNNGIDITITLKNRLEASVTNVENSQPCIVHTYVKVNDPNKFTLQLMSYQTNVTKVFINQLAGNEWPASITGVKTTVSGTATGKSYATGGAIVTLEDDDHTAVIKYAKPSSQPFPNGGGNYSGISVKAQIIAVEHREDRITHHRYGFYDWYESVGNKPEDFVTYISGHSASTNYKERDSAISANGTNYIMHFDTYEYTDVVVTFHYRVYKVLVDGVYKYYFDPDKIESDGQINVYHEEKTFSSTHEVKYRNGHSLSKIDASTTLDDIYDYVVASARNIYNDYYNYSFSMSDVSLSTADAYDDGYNYYRERHVTVNMQKTPRTYNVAVDNGVTVNRETDPVYYQTYVTVDSGGDSSVKWIDTASGTTIMTAPSYRFRVTGDITLRIESMGNNDKNLNDGEASTVIHTNTEIKEKMNNDIRQEILIQNFFINDFYKSDMIKYTKKIPVQNEWGDISYVDSEAMVYDDIEFVGGGVFYYSVDDTTGAPNKDFIISAGYVENGTYTTNTEAVGERLLEIIGNEDRVSSVTGLIDDDKKAACFGTPIDETVDYVRNQNTGLVYRYMPYKTVGYKTFSYTENNQTVEYTTIYDSAAVVNSNVYRQSTQYNAIEYVYAASMNNNPANEHKMMKLHSYYVYRYTDYENDDNGETVYKIIVSETPAAAPTYVNPNSAT